MQPILSTHSEFPFSISQFDPHSSFLNPTHKISQSDPPSFLSPIHPHFSVKIFTSSHFRTHMQRERERATTSTSPANLEPRSHLRLRRSTNPRTDLRLRAFDPSIYEPTNRSSTQSLCATNPRTNLSLSLYDFDFLCDFDWPTNQSTFLCDFDFLLSLSDPWFFLLLLWWCFGGFPVVWWWVLCGWWWKIVFSKCYQTHENIFYNNFHNATKHLKIFSFSENSIFGKIFIFRTENILHWTKHSLRQRVRLKTIGGALSGKHCTTVGFSLCSHVGCVCKVKAGFGEATL